MIIQENLLAMDKQDSESKRFGSNYLGKTTTMPYYFRLRFGERHKMVTIENISGAMKLFTLALGGW